MSKFASKVLKEVSLGDGEWVKIPSSLSYRQVMALTGLASEGEMSKAMLMECIKEWNLKDDDGVDVELTEDNIMNLKIEYIKIISDELTQLLANDQDKKK